MLEYIPFSIALAGSAIAGAWDLRTTEIPDIIPHAMIVIALAFWGIQSFLVQDYWLVGQSLLVGLGLLGMGFLMYFTGQWGGGDAKILAAIGFLLPANIFNTTQLLLPFPLSYTVNVFLLGAVYMIVYAVVFSFINRKIIHDFLANVKSSIKSMSLMFAVLLASATFLTYAINSRFGIPIEAPYLLNTSLTVSSLAVALMLVWKFVLSVEKVGFRRKIPVGKLREGDVLMDSKLWEGITKENISRIKKSGKRHVVIKDGVRFGPVFPIALLFTVYAGDLLAIFFNFV